MPLDLDKIKKRQKETEAKSRGGFWKPKEGKNYIRVFMFQHEVTKEDVKQGLFDKKLLGETTDELDRPVVRFFPDGGKPVFASDEEISVWRKKMDKAKTDKEKKALRSEGPQQHWMLNIVDMDGDEKKIVEFAANKTIYNGILGFITDTEFGEDVLGCKGRDFIITLDESKQGSDRYSVQLRDEKKSEKLPSSVEDGIKDYYDADVYASLAGEAEPSGEEKDEDDEEEEEDDDDSKSSGKKSDGGKSKKGDDDDDEKEDEPDFDEMDRDALIEFIEKHELSVDADEKKYRKDEDALREAVKEAYDEDNLDKKDKDDDDEEEEEAPKGKGKGGKK